MRKRNKEGNFYEEGLLDGARPLRRPRSPWGRAAPAASKSSKAGSKDSISYSPGKQEWGGYNGSTVEAYSTTTAAVTDRVQTGFGYYDPQGVWKHGTDLGDYKKLSDDPLTVEYTVNEKAVYQGKTPITCEDFYLDWVSQNPDWILEGQKAAGAVDEKSGEAQPLFNHVSSPEGYAHPVSQGPQCNEGEKKFTVKYDTVYPDWELNVGGPLPSHVVAKKIGMSKQDLFKRSRTRISRSRRRPPRPGTSGTTLPRASFLPPRKSRPSGPSRSSRAVGRPSSTSHLSETPIGGARRPERKSSSSSRWKTTPSFRPWPTEI